MEYAIGRARWHVIGFDNDGEGSWVCNRNRVVAVNELWRWAGFAPEQMCGNCQRIVFPIGATDD